MKEETSKFEILMQSLGMDLLILLKVIAVLFAAWFVERLIYFALRRGYSKAKAHGREEMTRYRFFRNGVRTMMVILALIAIIYTIPSLRSLALTLFAGAGARLFKGGEKRSTIGRAWPQGERACNQWDRT